MQLARAVLIVLALATMIACGDDDTSEAADTEPTTTAAPAGTAPIEVAATDYRFDGLPSEIDASATLELRNESDREVHELVALRLADGEDRSAEQLVALPQEELGALAGGPPAVVLVAPPGDVGFAAVGDGRLEEPGRYLLVCFIPTGADPDAYLDALDANPGLPPSVAGGPPHFASGMYADVIVR